MAKPVVKYVVDHPEITKYILPGGEVKDAVDQVIRDGRKFATTLAPVRTGGLVRGFNSKFAVPTSINNLEGRFGNSSKHARWVNNGTSRIRAKRGFMLIPTGPGQLPWSTTRASGGSTAFKLWNARGRKGKKGFTTEESVRGQRGQQFMERGLKMAMDKFKAGG